MGVSYLQWSTTLWPMSPPPPFSGNSRPGGNSHRACSLSFGSLLTFFRCCLFLPLHYTLSLGCHEVISECTVTGNKCVFVCVWCEIHVMWSETLKKKITWEEELFFYHVTEGMQLMCKCACVLMSVTIRLELQKLQWSSCSLCRLAQGEYSLFFLIKQ